MWLPLSYAGSTLPWHEKVAFLLRSVPLTRNDVSRNVSQDHVIAVQW